MAHQGRYRRMVTIDRDRSAPCGCRQILSGSEFVTVVWCPEHQDRPCPGPWRRSVPEPPDDWDYDEHDDGFYGRDEEDEFELALQECGQVPGEGGACMLAGTEFCDFECPFSDEVLDNYGDE